MQELLNLYAELVRGATDDQVIAHLNNLVKDAVAMADAIRNVVDQAKQRATPPVA